MSMLSSAGPERQPRARSNCSVSLSSEMRRVDSGQWRLGPVERREMILVGKTRHGVVGLRIEPGAGNAPFRRRGQNRQPSAGEQVLDQRRDEHGLARARQTRDAEP